MRIYETIQTHMIAHLLQLCKHELELDNLPPIFLIDDQPSVGGGVSFGEFTGGGIKVVTMGRHPMDVLRTLCHELVHWKQKVDNLPLDGSDGSDTENQANSLAGIIMRKFAHMYPQFFMDSLP